MPRTFDVVVIGGGIIGLAVAHALHRVLLGAPAEDVGYDRAVRLEAVHTPIRGGIALMLELAGAALVTAWTGLRPFSHDNLPYPGPVPGLHGAYAATGHPRSGIVMAPVTGLVLKEMIVGQPPTLPLEPYRVGRRLSAGKSA